MLQLAVFGIFAVKWLLGAQKTDPLSLFGLLFFGLAVADPKVIATKRGEYRPDDRRTVMQTFTSSGRTVAEISINQSTINQSDQSNECYCETTITVLINKGSLK